jgi:hypothetical protein
MNIEHEVNELLRRVAKLESKKPTPGPRGPAGPIDAAERAIGSRISESASMLKAASDAVIARTRQLNDELEAAIAKVNAIAERVEDRLNTLNERLSGENFLDHTILKVLAEYQIVQDGDVGDLLKFHIAKHVASLTPEVKQ